MNQIRIIQQYMSRLQNIKHSFVLFHSSNKKDVYGMEGSHPSILSRIKSLCINEVADH